MERFGRSSERPQWPVEAKKNIYYFIIKHPFNVFNNK